MSTSSQLTYNDSPADYIRKHGISTFLFLLNIFLHRWAGGRPKFRELGELAVQMFRSAKLSKVDSSFKMQAYAIILLRGLGHPYELRL